jgi:hypothetical protein
MEGYTRQGAEEEERGGREEEEEERLWKTRMKASSSAVMPCCLLSLFRTFPGRRGQSSFTHLWKYTIL